MIQSCGQLNQGWRPKSPHGGNAAPPRRGGMMQRFWGQFTGRTLPTQAKAGQSPADRPPTAAGRIGNAIRLIHH